MCVWCPVCVFTVCRLQSQHEAHWLADGPKLSEVLAGDNARALLSVLAHSPGLYCLFWADVVATAEGGEKAAKASKAPCTCHAVVSDLLLSLSQAAVALDGVPRDTKIVPVLVSSSIATDTDVELLGAGMHGCYPVPGTRARLEFGCPADDIAFQCALVGHMDDALAALQQGSPKPGTVKLLPVVQSGVAWFDDLVQVLLGTLCTEIDCTLVWCAGLQCLCVCVCVCVCVCCSTCVTDAHLITRQKSPVYDLSQQKTSTTPAPTSTPPAAPSPTHSDDSRAAHAPTAPQSDEETFSQKVRAALRPIYHAEADPVHKLRYAALEAVKSLIPKVHRSAVSEAVVAFFDGYFQPPSAAYIRRVDEYTRSSGERGLRPGHCIRPVLVRTEASEAGAPARAVHVASGVPVENCFTVVSNSDVVKVLQDMSCWIHQCCAKAVKGVKHDELHALCKYLLLEVSDDVGSSLLDLDGAEVPWACVVDTFECVIVDVTIPHTSPSPRSWWTHLSRACGIASSRYGLLLIPQVSRSCSWSSSRMVGRLHLHKTSPRLVSSMSPPPAHTLTVSPFV